MSIFKSGFVAFFVGLAITCAATLAVFALINYYADPLWIWGTKSALNKISVPFDIRAQRVNLMLHESHRFSTLIVGSSRVANFRLSGKANSFDFSVHTMLPAECADIVNTAQAINRGGFRRVLIGLDFETTNGHYREGLHPTFENLLKQAEDPWYKLKSTISASTLVDSIETISASVRGDFSNCTVAQNASPCYDNDRRFLMRPLSSVEWNRQSQQELHSYARSASTYWFDSGFKSTISACMKAAGPGAEAFITPEHSQLFNIEARMIDQQNYRRFVADAVDVFGSVIAFEPGKPIWSRSDTFFDLHHPSLATAKLISECLENGVDSCDPRLGAVKLDKATIDQYLATSHVIH